MAKATKMTASTATAKAALPSATAFDPSKIEIVRELTAEFSFVLEQPAYVKAMSAMKISDRKQRGETGGKSYGPPTVLPAFDYVQGKEVEIVLGKVLASTLDESYPNGDYVGRSFSITKHAPGVNKAGVPVKYSKYTVVEIKAPT